MHNLKLLYIPHEKESWLNVRNIRKNDVLEISNMYRIYTEYNDRPQNKCHLENKVPEQKRKRTVSKAKKKATSFSI